MIGNIGPLEIGIVVVVALLVFGPRRLPELGSGLGRGLREFKQGITGEAQHQESPSVAEVPTEATGATEPLRAESRASEPR